MAESQGCGGHKGGGDERSPKRDQDKLLPGGGGHEGGGDESSSKRDQDKLLLGGSGSNKGGGDESSSKRDQDKLLSGGGGHKGEGGEDERSSKRDQDKLLLGGGGGNKGGGDESSSKRDQDKFLPIGHVSRIIKKGLPPDAKITKEAKELIQEAANEFVSLITSEASDICRKERRKTLNGDDLLEAMAIFEFDDYIGPLKVYLEKYREIEGDPIRDWTIQPE